MAYPTVTQHAKRFPYTSIMASPYSCDPTGVVDCSVAIEQIKADQSNIGRLYIPHGTFLISSNLTIPVGMELEFEIGASFTVAVGVTLTIYCQVISSALNTVFTGAGTVVRFNEDIIYARDHGTVGTQAAIVAAISHIGSSQKTLCLTPGTWTISANLSIGTNINLKVLPGAILAIATTKTLTINGTLETGLYQIFSWTGTGKIVFGTGAIKEAFVEWWGGKGDDSTENLGAFQSAVVAYPVVRFLDGTYRVTGSILFNDTDVLRTIILQGAGLKTVIDFRGLISSDYCMKVNEDPATGLPVVVHPTSVTRQMMKAPHLVIQDLRMTGVNSSTPNLCKLRGAPVVVERCRFDGFAKGFVTGQEYTEPNLFRIIIWASLTLVVTDPSTGLDAADFFYEQNGGGDGSVLDQIHAFSNVSPTQGAHNVGLAAFRGVPAGGTVNAAVTNCVGGIVYGQRTEQFTYANNHTEDMGLGNPALYIKDGQATIRENWMMNNYDPATPPILIQDASFNCGLTTIEDNKFATRILGAYGTAAADIHFAGTTGLSRFSLRNNRRVVTFTGGGGAGFSVFGIRATSDDSGLNTALTGYPGCRLLSDDVEITRAQATWRVIPRSGLVKLQAYGSNPSINKAVNTQYVSTLTAATYYYRVAYYVTDTAAGVGLHTAKSAEVSQAVTANQAVSLQLTLNTGYSIARIWRGVAADTYTAYVDIPINQNSAFLFDCGAHISGVTWIASAIPAPPAGTTAMEGVQYSTTGIREFIAAAAPSSAEFTGVVGDRVKVLTPVAGQPKGWFCTVTASPGTWVADANL